MIRLETLHVLLLFTVLPVIPAEAVGRLAITGDESATPAVKDALGDPLPTDATARLGALRKGDAVPANLRNLPSVRGLVFSPDGSLIATRGEPADPSRVRTIHIWDARTGKLQRVLSGHDTRMTDLAFSPDGRYIVAGQPEHGAGLQIWDAKTGRKLRSLDGGRGRFHLLPDGKRLAVIAAFGSNDVVRVHDIATGNEVQRFVIDPNHKFAFSPDGSKLLTVRTGGRTAVRVIELRTGKSLLKLEGSRGQPSIFAFSPDSRTVAAGSSHRVNRDKYEHHVIVWEIATGEIVHRLTQHSGRILAMQFTPDGRYLATGSADRVVRVWELATGKKTHEFTGHRGPVSALAFSRDGSQLATGSFDRTALVWKMEKARKSFLPTGRLDEKALAKIWNDLASPTPANAYRAIGRLAAADAQAVGALKSRLTSILIPAQNKRIQQLIVELDDDDSIVRQRAMRELQKLRKIAKPILLKVIKETLSAEVRYRLRRILSDSKDSPRFSKSDIRRMMRVIHAVEYLRGRDAEAILQLIIKDFPAEAVVREAKETLKRLQSARKD